MGCGSCDTVKDGIPAGCGNHGSCSTGNCNKLNVFDWLANMELPDGQAPFSIVEVRFKNGRKDFYRNVNDLNIQVGDAVAVESNPGHDIGNVSLTGELVKLQMKKKGIKDTVEGIKKLYRKAREQDLQKWEEARNLEEPTMYKARTLALGLNLQMKISDVEYQGDRAKATFYYTADERVDFRELIKVLASEFKIRVEMRQIGARQEAGRLGGIGSCGRELCCATWLNDFRTVNTGAARYQQLSLNPQKLAGQCGKLKCCLNYELDAYVEAVKEFPNNDINLKAEMGEAFHQKTDIFKRTMWYSYKSKPGDFIALSVDRVKEILEMNKSGKLPVDIRDEKVITKEKEEAKNQPDYENVVGQDSLERFDKKKKQNGPHRPKHNHKRNNRNKPGNRNDKKPTT